MGYVCRDCQSTAAPEDGRCTACGSGRILAHPELDGLTIAHLDCDAFYANVEKRDNPALADKPVIVGGRKRGVVLTCCYIARRYGVRSAMPMFKALRRCPDAVVIRPDMEKYRAIGAEVRELMRAVTPQVEPLSVDEAFMDLGGTERLHGGSPARTLARLARRIEADIGITVSIGLSYNKFLAKIASGLDKPRGFSIIGRAEAVPFLAGQPVDLMWGVGAQFKAHLVGDGIATIADLQAIDEATLVARYGTIGSRLYWFARGEDERTVNPGRERKSVSAETTFEDDIADHATLEARLWPLCEKVSARLKDDEIGGDAVTLKLKTARFRLITRAVTLGHPTQLAETIYRAGVHLLAREINGNAYRLIGIGVAGLVEAAHCDPPDLADPGSLRRAAVERTIDAVRARFGDDALVKGRRFAAHRNRRPE
ncbi:MAG: DNA polymerase IV [Alphaproteobacteria bacterium]|nr:DNA polymerase IV [Alphaproteobacteria bacterium]